MTRLRLNALALLVVIALAVAFGLEGNVLGAAIVGAGLGLAAFVAGRWMDEEDGDTPGVHVVITSAGAPASAWEAAVA